MLALFMSMMFGITSVLLIILGFILYVNDKSNTYCYAIMDNFYPQMGAKEYYSLLIVIQTENNTQNKNTVHLK